MLRRIFIAFTLLGLVLFPVLARAETPADREVFALIVSSNKSRNLSRPDLRYADDDGARYHDLFRMMTPEANVTLLTSFDRDSERLFSDLAKKTAPPEKARVLAAFNDQTNRIREIVKKGGRVDFYFVFAGHGDVEDGKGFIELEDDKLVSDELTSLIAAVPATRSHVILDSCNSFFVINSRKPGGRRFATAAEAGERLNRALPNVGVFLSTSAQAETFEWSELGAGIFSHAVRSGLSGAADANGNGDVSYEELAAFVETATRDVRNPLYRPSVFSRGPSGRNDESLVSLKLASGRVKLPSRSGRVTVRDADELPWMDANFETGSDARIFLPERLARGATVAIDVQRFDVQRDASGFSLAASTVEPAKLAQRGPSDLWKTLFSRPFGPQAFAQYKDRVAEEPPAVYGVAVEDVQRMNELLWHAAGSAKGDRRLQGVGFAGIGLLYVAEGAYFIGRYQVNSVGSFIPFAVSAAPLSFAAVRLFGSSREERVYDWFQGELKRSGPSADLMIAAEAHLFDLARRDREERLFYRWFGVTAGTLAAAGTTAAVVAFSQDRKPDSAFFWGAMGGILTGYIALPVIGTFTPTYSERMADIWARDPSRLHEVPKESAFTIRPSFGGTSVGLSGTF